MSFCLDASRKAILEAKILRGCWVGPSSRDDADKSENTECQDLGVEMRCAHIQFAGQFTNKLRVSVLNLAYIHICCLKKRDTGGRNKGHSLKGMVCESLNSGTWFCCCQ